MESPESESSSNMKMKNWQWSIALFGFMISYLVLGAFIFDATETQNSLDAQQHLYGMVFQYYAKHSCLGNHSVMQEFGDVVTQHLSRGASLGQQYWIDSEEEEVIESTWIMPRAAMFSLTIITTIGYGNIVPRTFGGRVFCVVYALIGIPFMAFTLTIFGKSLDGFIKKYKTGMSLLERPIKSKRPRVVLQAVTTTLLITSVLVLLPALLLSYFQDWPYLDAIYFFFITVSTIGFGDMYLDGCVRCRVNIWFFVILFATYVFLGMCVITVLFRALTTYQREKFLEAESLVEKIINTASQTIAHPASHGDGKEEGMTEGRAGDTGDRDTSPDAGSQEHDNTLAVDVHL